jgi:hypothetical protein
MERPLDGHHVTVSDRRPIFARSLHLPVVVTDGSRIKNLNKTGVRLWSDHCRNQKCYYPAPSSFAALARGWPCRVVDSVDHLEPAGSSTGLCWLWQWRWRVSRLGAPAALARMNVQSAVLASTSSLSAERTHDSRAVG